MKIKRRFWLCGRSSWCDILTIEARRGWGFFSPEGAKFEECEEIFSDKAAKVTKRKYKKNLWLRITIFRKAGWLI